MKVYIKVTRDKYELIKEMAETPQELAWKCGAKASAVYKGLERFKKGERCQWQMVEISE